MYIAISKSAKGEEEGEGEGEGDSYTQPPTTFETFLLPAQAIHSIVVARVITRHIRVDQLRRSTLW